MGPKKIDDSLQPSAPRRGAKKVDDSLLLAGDLRSPKRVEKIKITRKKEHSPLINKPSPQEPDPPSASADSPTQEPDPPSASADSPLQEPDPPSASADSPLQEPDPPSASADSPTEESISLKDKLLTLLESKDEDYIIDFIYECMLKMKEREDEIKESDPQMWSLIMELNEMMDP